MKKYITYNKAKKLLEKPITINGELVLIHNCTEYNAISKETKELLNLPIRPHRCADWRGQWVNWIEFLRKKAVIPVGAKKLNNNGYYQLDNFAYSVKRGKFKQLKRHKHSQGKYASVIKDKDGIKSTVYFERWKERTYSVLNGRII